MFPFWLILGIAMILLGIFNKQIRQFLGLKSMSEILTIPNLKHSSQLVEKMGRWLVTLLGASFLAYGVGTALPDGLSFKISFALLGLSGLIILAMIGITIANWKAR